MPRSHPARQLLIKTEPFTEFKHLVLTFHAGIFATHPVHEFLSLLFEHLLKAAGLSTKTDVYPGLPHGFWTTCPDLSRPAGLTGLAREAPHCCAVAHRVDNYLCEIDGML